MGESPNNQAPATSKAKMRSRNNRLIPFAIIFGVLLFWEAASRVFQIPEYLLPSPSVILETLVVRRAMFLHHMVPTALEAVAGFILGNGIAVLLAIIFIYVESLERAFMPMAITLRSIPLVALAPLLVLLMGNGYEPRIVIVAIISFFPTLVNTTLGLSSVDASALEMFHSLSASEWQIFTKLRVPSSLPYIFASLKVAATSAVLGAIIAEWIGSNEGLGYLIITSTYKFEAAELYATMVLSSVSAIAFYLITDLAENLIVDWNTPSTPQ